MHILPLVLLSLCGHRALSQMLEGQDSSRGVWGGPTTFSKFMILTGLLSLANTATAQTTTAHIIPHSHDDPGWLSSFVCSAFYYLPVSADAPSLSK